MNILPPDQHPGRRGTLVMIAAHAVYGATLGALSRRVLPDVSDPDDLGSRHGSAREV